jgi:tRNA(fMet)-specific endonuclease VapC
MTLLLDTNIASKLIRGREAVVRENYRKAINAREVVKLPVLVVHELYYGAYRVERLEKNLERISVFMGGLDGIVDFVAEDAKIAGEVRAALGRDGLTIGPFDTLIAAQTLRLGATLVTGNVREFSRVDGLKWMDWTVA